MNLGKKLRVTGKRMICYIIAFIAFIALISIVSAGIWVTHSNDAKAKIGTYQDVNNSVTLTYTFDPTIINAPATEVYVYGQEGISKDIVIPDYFTDEYGKHYVTSIGIRDISNKDSFFFNSTLAGIVNIDLSQCSKLERINDYAFYYESYAGNISLPVNIKSIGNYVSYQTSNKVSYNIPNPNVAFIDNSGNPATYDGTVKFCGPTQSTARDFVGMEYENTKYSTNNIKTFKYTLDYLPKSGTIEVLQDYVYVVATDNTISEDTRNALNAMAKVKLPTQSHYDFRGYYTSLMANSTLGDGEPFVNADGEICATEVAKDMSLKAGFSPCVYTISYSSNVTDEEKALLPTTYTYGIGVQIPDLERTGYTWGCWYTNSSYSGNSLTSFSRSDYGNVTLYPKFTACSYTVKFDGNHSTSGSMTTIAANYDKSFVIPDSSYLRTGYQFTGWNTKADGNGTEYLPAVTASNLSAENNATVTLYAQWEAQTVDYKVTYIYRGLEGEDDETLSQTLRAKTDSMVEPDPSVKAKSGFNTPVKQKVAVLGNGTTKITYIFTRKNYIVNVTKDSGFFDVTGSGTYPYGTKITLTALVGAGYTFDSWKASDEDVVLIKADNTCTFTLGASNITIDAKTTANTYGISYVLGNDAVFTTPAMPTYTHGIAQNLPTPDTLRRTGYVFVGWYDNAAFAGDSLTEISASVYGYKSYYAKWKLASYTITYETNGGSLNGTQESGYTYRNSVNLPSESQITRNGYTFSGWYDNKDFENEPIVSISSSDYGNKTFYAKWEPRTYTITYDLDGGKLTDREEEEQYTVGNVFTLPTAEQTTKAGFQFNGWYTDSFCTGEPVTELTAEEYGTKVLYASWNTTPYSITFDTDGGTMSGDIPETYRYGTTVSLPVLVTKYGYSFVGWWDGQKIASQIESTEYGNKIYVAFWQNNSTTTVESTSLDGDITDAISNTVDITSEGVSDTGYYYTELEDSQKKIYASLYNRYKLVTEKGKDQNRDSVLLTSSTSYTHADVADAQTALVWDHPEIFWVRYFGSSEVSVENGKYVCAIIPIEAYSETLYLADLEQYSGYFTKAINSIGIIGSETTYEKLEKIHDYVINTYSYDNYGVTLNSSTSNDTRAAGRMLVTTRGCCEAYAKITKMFCDYFKIPCVLVQSSTHMWNEVQIDNKWYGMDTTWDDNTVNSRMYFLKGTTTFSDVDHEIKNAFYVSSSGSIITDFGCFPAPTISTDYVATSNKQNTDNASGKGNGTSKSNAKELISKGKTYTVGSLKYKVLSVSSKNSTVQVVGAKKKTVKSITIPATVKINKVSCKITAVGTGAFKQYKKLSKVTIGKNVTKIGSKAFYKDSKLKKIVFKGNKIKTIGSGAIKGIYKKATLDTAKNKIKTYKKKFTAKTGYKKSIKIK